MNNTPVTHEGKHILIYTDGSCGGNPGPGGYAAVLRRMDGSMELKKRRILNFVIEETTNNRMEMMAAIVALEAIKPEECPIIIVSDSEYVVKGVSDWLQGWKQKGWRNSSKKLVKNHDLWQRLDKAAQQHGDNLRWVWVRGHNDDQMNEEVDRLARKQMEYARAAFYGFTAAA